MKIKNWLKSLFAAKHKDNYCDHTAGEFRLEAMQTSTMDDGYCKCNTWGHVWVSRCAKCGVKLRVEVYKPE